jgi:hypothetical protein
MHILDSALFDEQVKAAAQDAENRHGDPVLAACGFVCCHYSLLLQQLRARHVQKQCIQHETNAKPLSLAALGARARTAQQPSELAEGLKKLLDAHHCMFGKCAVEDDTNTIAEIVCNPKAEGAVLHNESATNRCSIDLLQSVHLTQYTAAPWIKLMELRRLLAMYNHPQQGPQTCANCEADRTLRRWTLKRVFPSLFELREHMRYHPHASSNTVSKELSMLGTRNQLPPMSPTVAHPRNASAAGSSRARARTPGTKAGSSR